tara:strand:+ start:53 stop:799 length:747 start_codon:yes stop_codon:yes gene_type:complete
MFIKFQSTINGLDLIKKNRIYTDISELSFSYYPGPNLPSVSVGIQSSNRYNKIDYLYISANNDTTDTRIDVRTNNYNIGISDKFNLLGDQTIHFNLFITNVKDLLIDDKIKYDNSYFSPRSYLRNISFSIFTQISNQWESNISYNNNYYNAGKNYNDYSLYIEQNVSNINFNIIYYGETQMIKKLNSGINFTYGFGNQEFSYLGINTTLNQYIIKNFEIVWNIQFQKKWVEEKMFNNSIFTAKLLYAI